MDLIVIRPVGLDMIFTVDGYLSQGIRSESIMGKKRERMMWRVGGHPRCTYLQST